MNIPERIFAIGGAGKAIALQLVDADWVVDSVLRPRPSPKTLTITIIDTAEGEENSDRRRVQEARRRIERKKDELRDPQQGRLGDIDIEYKLVTDNIQLNGQIDLLGDNTVPRIAGGNGMAEEDWWLKEQHINENLDFAKGVVRKRGLGKAIYYKAYAEDDEISTVVDLPDKGKVAVIVGLGGGTGSGLFLDVVQQLQQKQRTAEITLFGILPNHTEGIEENTNAFAALSELEYLSLQDENLFKDRILLPIDPTGFDGKRGNRLHTGQFLEELDESFIYLLAAYYNTQGMEDVFVGTPSFAPFTIGIPQVLRYNVEAINEARESLRDILAEKEEALDAEEELYSEVDRFLSRYYDIDTYSGSELRDVDKTDLRERFESVEELTTVELFSELEYQSLDIFKDILSDAREEGDSITKDIDIAAGSLRAGVQSGMDQGFVDDIDELLAEILETSIRLLDHRKELLERRNAIQDNRVRKTVEYLLLLGEESINPGVQLNRLEGKLEDVKQRRDRLETNLEEAKAELEELEEAQSEKRQRQLDDWKSRVRPDVEQYRRIDDLSVQSRLADLQGDLEAFRNDVAGADDKESLEAVSAQGVIKTLDALEQELDAIGVDFSQKRQAVKGSLPALKGAKEAWLEMNEEEGTFEKLMPWQSSTEEARKQAHKDYRMKKSELSDKEVFGVAAPGTSFSAEIRFTTDDTEAQVRQRKEELKAAVSDALRSMMDEPDLQFVQELERELESGGDVAQLSRVAEDAFRAQASGTAEVRERKQNLEEELEETEAKVDIYEATSSLFQQLNNIRSTYEQKQSTFNERRRSHADESTQATRSVSTQDESYVYVKNIKPNDVLRTRGDSNINDSDLFKNQEEVQRLESNLEELARNARKQKYTGLKRRKFSKGRQRYNDLKINVAVLSQAAEQLELDQNIFEDTFEGSFDIGGGSRQSNKKFSSWSPDIGDRWDIGLSVFIDGVFLDNLRKAVDADGYFEGYREQHASLGDDILVHHSYGLDQGKYVRRKEVLNLEDEEDVGFFLREEPDVVTDLLDEYVEVVDTDETDVPAEEVRTQQGGDDGTW